MKSKIALILLISFMVLNLSAPNEAHAIVPVVGVAIWSVSTLVVGIMAGLDSINGKKVQQEANAVDPNQKSKKVPLGTENQKGEAS